MHTWILKELSSSHQDEVFPQTGKFFKFSREVQRDFACSQLNSQCLGDCLAHSYLNICILPQIHILKP